MIGPNQPRFPGVLRGTRSRREREGETCLAPKNGAGKGRGGKLRAPKRLPQTILLLGDE